MMTAPLWLWLLTQSLVQHPGLDANTIQIVPRTEPRTEDPPTAHRKVSAKLAALLKEGRRCGQRCMESAAGKYDAEVAKDRIRLKVRARMERDVPEVEKRLTHYGGKDITKLNDTLFVLMPARNVEKLARSKFIDEIGLTTGGGEPAKPGEKR